MFWKDQLILLFALVLLASFYPRLSSTKSQILSAAIVCLASFSAFYALYGFSNVDNARWVIGELVYFFLPGLFVSLSIAGPVWILRRLQMPVLFQTIGAYLAGVVAVVFGPIAAYAIGFMIGGDF